MTGKRCVVTGATAGIGYEIARGLVRTGAQVVGVGRDKGRCERAERLLNEEAGLAGRGGRVLFEVADLSSQAEVRRLARAIRARWDGIDVLVNNAGLFSSRFRETIDGVEMQYAVNYLAVFLLTSLLVPAARPGMRVITVSSGSHYTGKIHWRDVNLRRCYFGLAAYDQSKLATVLFTYELARRIAARTDGAMRRDGLPRTEIDVYAADPGLVNTEIGFKNTGAFVKWFWRLRSGRGISPAQSAATILFLASSSEVAGRSGLYWYLNEPRRSSSRSYSLLDAARLWGLSEQMCGTPFLSGDLPT